MVIFGPVLVERAKLALETLGLICPLGSICLFLFYSVGVDHFGFPERTLLTKKASILLWFRVGSLVRSEICIQHRVFNISPHRIFLKIQLKDFLGDYEVQDDYGPDMFPRGSRII